MQTFRKRRAGLSAIAGLSCLNKLWNCAVGASVFQHILQLSWLLGLCRRIFHQGSLYGPWKPLFSAFVQYVVLNKFYLLLKYLPRVPVLLYLMLVFVISGLVFNNEADIRSGNCGTESAKCGHVFSVVCRHIVHVFIYMHLYIFMPLPNAVWPEADCFVPFVCASMCAFQNIVNTISCRVFDTFSPNLHQRWDRDECVKFWDQKVKVQGHGRITYAGAVTAQSEA